MFSRYDLKEYRLMSGLSLRDVARYCDISAQLIGQVENGEKNMTENNYKEIINGINRAKQSIANGTFEADKEKEKAEQKAKEEAEKREKAFASTKATKKPVTKKSNTTAK